MTWDVYIANAPAAPGLPGVMRYTIIATSEDGKRRLVFDNQLPIRPRSWTEQGLQIVPAKPGDPVFITRCRGTFAFYLPTEEPDFLVCPEQTP